MLDQDMDRFSHEVVVADLCEGFEVLLDSVEGLLSINTELRQEIVVLQKEMASLTFSHFILSVHEETRML